MEKEKLFMSILKEQQMQEWQIAVDTILVHVDSEDTVLRARARAINRLLGDVIQSWINCDTAHTYYTKDSVEGSFK